MFMKHLELSKEINNSLKKIEKTLKSMSLSGITGILIGVYAFIASYFVRNILYSINKYTSLADVFAIFEIAIIFLLVSVITVIGTALWKEIRKKRTLVPTRDMQQLIFMGITLLTGGLVVFIFLIKGYYSLIAATLLLFYGMGLLFAYSPASKRLLWVALFDILLGLVALWMPIYGLYCLSIGLGLLHLVYGLTTIRRI